MTFNFDIKRSMQKFELKSNMTLDENPNLINVLVIVIIHFLISKYSYLI